MPFVVLAGPGSDEDETPRPEPPAKDQIDPAELQELVEDLIRDNQKAKILAWIWKAKPSYSPLTFRALETALALFSTSNPSTLEEVNGHKPTLNADSLGRFDGTIFKVKKTKVSLKNDSVKDFLDSNETLNNLDLWEGKDLEQLVARACVTYLSLDDFRDLPLPTTIKGLRGELQSSDPFLTYASNHWHHHIRSSQEAKLLEPHLSQILDPDQNNLVLWTDQSSSYSTSGPRTFFRSRSEVAIKRDIPWLVPYLLESSGSSEPEDLFPARDLAQTVQTAPKIVQALVNLKPEYYLPALMKKKVLKEALQGYQGGLNVMQTVIPKFEYACFPAAVLKAITRNRKGDKILELLFSKLKDVPITNGMLATAPGNNQAGTRMLKLLFQKEPSIRVTEDMIRTSLYSSNSEALLFEQDKDAPVNESLLIKAIHVQMGSKKMKYLLSVRPDIQITPQVLGEAVRLGRYSTVKLLFEHDKDLAVTEDILKIGASDGNHDMDTLEFLASRSDPSLITSGVLAAGTRRLNSPHKATEVLLRHNPEAEILDEVLIESMDRDLYGESFDVLLEHKGGEEVSHSVTDKAIKCHKRLRTWTWRAKDAPTPLTVLQNRVPNDPYLKQMLDETDLEPPPPVEEPRETGPRPTAVPDAASSSDIGRLKEALSEGVDVNATHGSSCGCDRTNGQGTAIQRAAKQRDIAMVRVLLEHGANPDLQEGRYGNPLQEAAMEGDLELVKLLVEHKASINLSGGLHGSPMSAAAKADDVNVMRYFLDNGGDINFTDDDGWTPYLHAVASESYDVARFLLGVEPALASMGELIALPPGKLVNTRKTSTVEIGEDGLTVTTDATEAKELRNGFRVRSDHLIIPTSPYYFEMTVVRLGSDGKVAIGFDAAPFSTTGFPGHRDNSWGYHGDDGHVFDEGDYRRIPECPTYGVGDVVGCGIDFGSKTAYFTKNGTRLDAMLYMISGELYPMIGGGDEGMELKVNFGESPFMYQG